MVSKRGQDILSAYYSYKSGNNPTGSVQNTVSAKDVEVAQAVYNHKQSELQINQIDRQLDDITNRLDEKTNDYRMRNPNQDMAQVNLKLRSQDPAYGSLLDDRQNLLEQKQLLQDRVSASERVIEKDIVSSAQQSFSGISNSRPMDARPVIPSNVPKYNTTFGQNTVGRNGELINPKSKEGQTIQAIYDRQTQDRIDNAVQSNYFWQLTAGKVPIGKALYSPETTNTYYYKDQKLSDMKDKDTRMALTEQFLKERGQSMDTPIGEVKFSPTKYTQAREQARKSAESDFTETQIPMGDLRDLIPDQTKKGDYSGYIPPEQYRKQLLSPQNTTPYQYNSDERLKDSGKIYEKGFGETWKLSPPMTSELSILMFGTPSFAGQQLKTEKEVVIDRPVSLAGFSASEQFTKGVSAEPFNIAQTGKTPSLLSGLNFLMFGMPVANAEKQSIVVPKPVQPLSNTEPQKETDWLGGEITEIPDNPSEQFLKGLSAEPFNIAQTGKQLITGQEQEYAPSLIGDTLEAFQSGEIEYKDYGDDFGENLTTFFENASRTVKGFQDPEVQTRIGESFGEFGERLQKYPIYYIGSGITEVGSMVLPIGKISTALRATTKGVEVTKSAVKTKSLDPLKEAVKSTDKKAIEIAQSFAPEQTVKLVKIKGKSAIFIDKVIKNTKFMPQLTTKTKEMVKTKIKFGKADKKGKIKVTKEKRILSNEGAKIEEIGDKRFLLNLGEGEGGKGFGWAIIDLKNKRTGIVMKQFQPLDELPERIVRARTKDYPVEQLGDIHWFANRQFVGSGSERASMRKMLQQAKDEAKGGKPFDDDQLDYLFKEGQYSNEPVFLFQGGKPFFPVRDPVTKTEMFRDYMITYGKKLGLFKDEKTLYNLDRGENPLWVGESTFITGKGKGIKVPESPETRFNEMVETAGKQRDELEAFANRKQTPFMKSFDDTGKSSKGGRGSKGNDDGGKINKGNDGASTVVKSDNPDPSIPIGRKEVDEMLKIINQNTPKTPTASNTPYGSMFAPLAYGQGYTSPKESTKTVTSTPQRIGTNNLFIPNEKIDIEIKSNVIPKTTTPQEIRTDIIPRISVRETIRSTEDVRNDVVSQTDIAVKQIGKVSTQLDLKLRQDLVPKLNQELIPRIKDTEIFPPKTRTSQRHATKPRPKPIGMFAPPIVLPPFNLRSDKRKKKKKKTSKDKKKLAVWAVPDVWFDAKGYYFQDGQAYLTGASAKKALRKSKKR